MCEKFTLCSFKKDEKEYCPPGSMSRAGGGGQGGGGVREGRNTLKSDKFVGILF